MDSEAVEKAVRDLIVALGDDPEREGLRETPKRVAGMYAETLEGMAHTNEEIAAMFGKCFDHEGDDMVVVRDIEAFSYCEHHLALMYDMRITVAYLPKGKVIGLSKVARIATMAAKRLQLQERIGTDIADILGMVLGTDDIAVLISGKHSCMTARGIKSSTSYTTTSTLRGRFREDPDLRAELMAMAGRGSRWRTEAPRPSASSSNPPSRPSPAGKGTGATIRPAVICTGADASTTAAIATRRASSISGGFGTRSTRGSPTAGRSPRPSTESPRGRSSVSGG